MCYNPLEWGDRTIVIAAEGGKQRLVLRSNAVLLSLWEPANIAPQPGMSFGFYVHADKAASARTRAADAFRRATNNMAAVRPTPVPHAERQAAMLYVHDLRAAGTSLREIAGELFNPLSDDWRLSSERSDLRRLADAASEMVAGGYRRLLGS